MADRDRPAAGVRFVQPAEATAVGDGDVSTSSEALAVLAEQGADAWRAWVAQHPTGERNWFPGEEAAVLLDRAADPDGSNLHEYWTAGAGLARWVNSRTPWRKLRQLLSKYLSGENLDATASSWYRDVFGALPQDR